MAKQTLSPNIAAVDNLAVLAAALELGAAALQRVLGGDEAANQVQGATLSTQDIQEMLASRIAKAVGA